MNRLPWFKFYPKDWLTGTRELSAQEKAVWIDLLAYMWEAPERGQITSTWEGIARMTGVPWAECESITRSLIRKKVLDVTEIDCDVTLMSRRIKMSETERESARLRKQRERSRESHGIVTREIQKSEVIKDKDTACAREASPPEPETATAPKPSKAQQVVDLWNSKAHLGLPRVSGLTTHRENQINARIAEHQEHGFWTALIERISQSKFLVGQNGNWKASLDWVLKPANMTKIIEGNYDDR